MNDDAIREQVCGGKQRHTKALARQLARRRKARGEAGMDAYGCPFCGSYHVGHRPPAHVLTSLRDRARHACGCREPWHAS